jgi:hypothetical protein
MSHRISSHIRSNVVGYVALFFAFTGGAYAVTIAPKNSVVSRSIKNRQVKKADLAANAVNGSKVADDTLTGADVNEASLGQVLDAAHATNSDQLGGSPPSAFAPSAKKILVDTDQTGTTDLGMVGPYHFTVDCTVDTGTSTNTVRTLINGPAGTVDRWGTLQLGSGTPTAATVHASVPAATDTSIGFVSVNNATGQLGETGEIKTGSTLVTFQLAEFASQGGSNLCSVHGTAEAVG